MDNVESIIQPLRDRSEEIEAQLEEIERTKEPLKEELKTITRILRAANPTAPTTSRVKLPTSDRTKAGEVRLPRIDQANVIFDWIASKDVGVEFRGMDIRNEVKGLNSSAVSGMTTWLREENYVRFVRQQGTSRLFTRTGQEPSAKVLERLGR